MNEIKIFSPATVANLSCGFDVLGLCLDNVGDEMIIRKTPKKGIFIKKVNGYKIPLEPHKNVAGVSAQAIYEKLNVNHGFEIEITKNIKPGSGIGSSAASASGAVFGINALCGYPFTKKALTKFAMKGEAIASGCEHADNIAPGIFGNITLIRSYAPLDILEIKAPKELYITVIHPQVEVKTAEARALLGDQVTMSDAIKQLGNLGSLISGLHTSDYKRIGNSLNDYIAEPKRKVLIPKYNEVKKMAKSHGALGSGISGSGPSIFVLTKGLNKALKIKSDVEPIYEDLDIKVNCYISKVNPNGIKILE